MMPVTNLSPREDETLVYRHWLRGLVKKLAPTYHNPEIFNIAWDTRYVPTVPNDQNRAQDGIDLRARYMLETSNGLPALGECTMLEFLIGLSIRLNDTDYDPTMPDRVGPWFWALLENMDLIEVGDHWIYQGFDRLNTREYSYDGYGGLFPLRHPKEDQRLIEVWYQMQAYLIENRY
jgi:hypothetical protein